MLRFPKSSAGASRYLPSLALPTVSRATYRLSRYLPSLALPAPPARYEFLLLLHLLEDLFDAGALILGEAGHRVGFLAAGLDLDAVPEPAGVIMVAGDFLPWDFLVGAAQPKDAVGLNKNLLGRDVNFLRDESA